MQPIELYDVCYIAAAPVVLQAIVSKCIELYGVAVVSPHQTIYFATSKSKTLIYNPLHFSSLPIIVIHTLLFERS